MAIAVEEARRDTERLDWLLERPSRMPIQSPRGYIVQEWVGHTTGRGNTPREAIDAAMNNVATCKGLPVIPRDNPPGSSTNG
jgi:hypothetical protein